MAFFKRLIAQAVQEFASDPEKREEAKRVLREDVQPRAKKAWNDAQPEIQSAKKGLMRFAERVRQEFREGRDGD